MIKFLSLYPFLLYNKKENSKQYSRFFETKIVDLENLEFASDEVEMAYSVKGGLRIGTKEGC